jgi:A/G-specific adenine glycosylase
MNFSQQIINWYNTNKRSLPWRETKNPYKIWLSEIILQQTKVAQGLPYYCKIIAAFPTIKDLAKATEDEVLKLWQGLGYYSRARHLHSTAKEICEKHNGIFPNSYEDIIKLKGIGTYTAAAIASFSFDLPHAVVDGNVIRVLSRYFGVDIESNSAKGKKEFQNLAQKLLLKGNAAENNQAIMEFGALQCRPKSTNCNNCSLQNNCYAYNQNVIYNFPTKTKRIKIKKRYFEFFIINQDDSLLIQKRKNGIWKGLYQFPLIETQYKNTKSEIVNSKKRRDMFKKSFAINHVSRTIKHKLSHQTIYARFWHVTVKSRTKGHVILIKKEDIRRYPIPKLIEKYLKNIGIL